MDGMQGWRGGRNLSGNAAAVDPGLMAGLNLALVAPGLLLLGSLVFLSSLILLSGLMLLLPVLCGAQRCVLALSE